MRRRRLRWPDLVRESASAVVAKPGRAALTALGTILGVGALVATLGLTSTARAQISAQFDEYAATEVRVGERTQGSADEPLAFPADADERLRRLPGVRSSGVLWPVETGGAGIRRRWNETTGGSSAQLPLFAASPGAVDVVALEIVRGRGYDDFHERRGEPVVLLSQAAARALSITDVDRQPAVFVGDQAFTVIGIYTDSRRHPEVLAGAIVPATTAVKRWGTATTGHHEMVVETRRARHRWSPRRRPWPCGPTSRVRSRRWRRRIRSGCGPRSTRRWPTSSSCWRSCRSRPARSASRTRRSCRCWSGSPRSACGARSAPAAATSRTSSCSRARCSAPRAGWRALC